jgi:type III restriction enzyme
VARRDHDLTLIPEVTGEAKKEKQAKVATAEHLWVEAVNKSASAGRWAFQEIVDPWDAEHVIRAKFLEPAEARR